MAINFDNFKQEESTFLNKLAKNLGHPQEKSRTGILVKAVLHALRDRIMIREALEFFTQLPTFLKVVFVENWKYNDKPERLRDKEEFLSKIEVLQVTYGEDEFSWSKSTEELTATVFESLNEYLIKGEMQEVTNQLPADMKVYF